jgi:putative membrane protein
MFAYGGFGNGFPWWWIIPIAMMILCFLMMLRRRGCMTNWSGSHHDAGSAQEILDKRYARGEIGKEEYEQKKKDITQG